MNWIRFSNPTMHVDRGHGCEPCGVIENPSGRARPIDVWPPRRFAGKPGYSAGHYARLAGAPDDPLTVAERFAARRIGDDVHVEAHSRASAGESIQDILLWIQTETTRRRAESWERLSTDWGALIAELERAPRSPTMRRLLAEARREAPIR